MAHRYQNRSTIRSKRYSILDEVERDIARHRRRNSGAALIVALVILFVMAIVFFGGQMFLNWSANYGPTGEFNMGMNNPLDRVDIWQTEPRSSDRVWK